MTAVADAPPHSDTTPRPRSRSGGPFPVEAALVLVTLVVAIGLRRIFADTSFLPDVVLAAVASHLVAMTGRRLGVGAIAATITSLVLMAIAVAWLRFPDTLGYGVPGPDTLSELRSELSTAWDQFGVVKAPVEVNTGFVVASMVAVWIIALVADLAAFRLGSAVQALAPSSVLLVFIGMLGTPTNRTTVAALYAASALGFVLIHRVAQRPAPTTAARRRQRRALGRGAVIIAGAVAVASLLGPRLPGVEDPPVFDWRALDDPDRGITLVSPLVDIRGRLVNQSDAEVFSVVSERPTYWRMAALDDFDGSVWGWSGSYRPASGDLADSVSLPDAPAISQTFTIASLGGIWLPAAWSPTRVQSGAELSWDPESGTLASLDGIATNESYTVISADLPAAVSPDLLRSLARSSDPEFVAGATELPADFSPTARRLAEEVTAGANNDFDRAMALQAHFRSYTYDLDAASGHDNNRVEQFLTERRGYCEQFSGTFAAMARHLGMPARVAVGFTPGVRQDDGSYLVRGEHYHAWPEVHFEGVGWVPFEPTPGRGSPSAEQYTDVPAQQAASGDPQTATTLPSTDATVPDVSLPDEGFFDPAPVDATPSGTAAPLLEPDAGTSPWFARLLVALATLALVAGMWSLIVPALRRRQIRRRRARARTEADFVLAAWDELIEEMALAGVRIAGHETPTEFVSRLTSETVVDGSELMPLAQAVDEARFSGRDELGLSPEQAEVLVAQSRRRLELSADRTERFRRRVDPRPLLLPGWPQPEKAPPTLSRS